MKIGRVILVVILIACGLEGFCQKSQPANKSRYPAYDRYKGEVKRTRTESGMLYEINCCLLEFHPYVLKDSVYRFVFDSGYVYRQMITFNDSVLGSCPCVVNDKDPKDWNVKTDKMYVTEMVKMKSVASIMAFDVKIEYEHFGNLNEHFYLEMEIKRKANGSKYYKVTHFGYFYSEL